LIGSGIAYVREGLEDAVIPAKAGIQMPYSIKGERLGNGFVFALRCVLFPPPLVREGLRVGFPPSRE